MRAYVKILIGWRQEYMYCIPCRERHRDKGINPICDTKDECAIVKSWEDDDGIHREPFQLLPENHLAVELYFRIIGLSDLQSMSWSKGKGKNQKQYTGSFPSLSAMKFVLENFLPRDFDMDEFDLLVEKITLIHSIRYRNFTG